MQSRDRLTVLDADVTDPAAVDAAVAGGDAVLSVLGVPYSPKPVSVYSAGTANIIAAMTHHGVRRLAVAGTAALDPGYRSTDSVIFTRLMEPLFMRLPGKTVYADNARMEELIQASSLDWTIIRACWLFDSAATEGYQVVEGSIRGMFTARPLGGVPACATSRRPVRPQDGRSSHPVRHPQRSSADMARGDQESEGLMCGAGRGKLRVNSARWGRSTAISTGQRRLPAGSKRCCTAGVGMFRYCASAWPPARRT